MKIILYSNNKKQMIVDEQSVIGMWKWKFLRWNNQSQVKLWKK